MRHQNRSDYAYYYNSSLQQKMHIKSKPFYKITQKPVLKNPLIMKAVIPENKQIMVARFNYEDTLAACGYDDGTVNIFNLGTNHKISEIHTGHPQSQPVNALRWRPINSTNGRSVLLVANTNGQLYQFAAKTGQELYKTREQNNYILALDYHPSGTTFCTAGKDNQVRVYDEETKKITQTLNPVVWMKQGHNNRIFSVKYNKGEPDLLASGGWDHNISIWDTRTENVASCFYGPKISGDTVDVKGHLLLTGSQGGFLQLWDMRYSKEVALASYQWQNEEGHKITPIYCAQFCNNGSPFAVASGGCQVKIFDLGGYSQFQDPINLEDKSDREQMGKSEDTLKDYGDLEKSFESQIVQVCLQKQNLVYSCDSGYLGTRFLAGGKNGSVYYFGNNKTLQ